MESAACLSQELQPSTSQPSATGAQSSAPIAAAATGTGTGSDDSLQPKFVTSPPPFLYNIPPNNTSSYQSSSSSPSVMNSVSSGSVAFIKPPVVSVSSSTSFSYNIPQTESASGMPVGSGHSEGTKKVSFSAASLQPPVPGQLARPNAFLQGSTAQVMPPHSPVAVPRESSSNAANFSYNGNQHLIQKDTSLPSNATGHVAPRPSVSSVMPVAHSIPQPGHSTLGPTSNSASPSYWRPIVPHFQVPPGVSSIPVAPSASNPSLLTHPQGLRLQPGPSGGLSRPPLVPYPSAFPGSFPLSTYGSSVLPCDAQPPGTSVGVLGVSSRSSVASDSCLATVSDSSMHVHGTGFKEESAAVEQSEVWSAHRTETGAVYYYNAVTGESTYQKPGGFKGELDRVISQPTPISWEKCEGTDWSLVTTNDGKKYYYNAKMKLSSWQIPTEVAELKKRQDGDALKEQSMSVPNSTMLTEKGSAPLSLSAPAVTTGGRDSIALRATSAVPGASSALNLIKKKLQESVSPAAIVTPAASSGAMPSELNGSMPGDVVGKGPHSENGKDKLKDNNADGSLSDSSSDSEDVDGGPTKEECATQFKEMLKERGVAPFSKWEKELPKIVFDPRFKAIPSYSARRALFEHFVRTRAEEERKERRAAQKAAIEGYKQLLEEAKEDIDHNTDYQTFKRKWGHDPRFEALDRKEREVLLNERVLPLKRSIEEEVRAKRSAAISSFKSMLREKGDIITTSRWSKVKDSLRNDPRYKSVKREEREALFDEYLSELKASLEEAEREAKSRRDEEEKLRERERALRKRKEREEQEVERVRSKARRKEAIESYQALLVETIKDPQVTWTDSKPKLEKDPQGRAANPYLDQVDLERLFREHAKLLHERCAHEFKALLVEVITVDASTKEHEDGKTVTTSWSTAKRLLKADPRYTKMPRKDRESLWRRHVDDLQRRLKSTVDQDSDKHGDISTGSTVDSRKYLSGSRRTHDR